MTNPYAPPRAVVKDVRAPGPSIVPADRGTRLGAYILDAIVMGCMTYLPFGFSVGLAMGLGRSAGNQTTGPIMAVGGLLTLIGFITWCWITIMYVKRNGQSIAKKMLGIKVVRSDGSPITLGRLFWLRNIVNSIIAMIPLYALLDVLFIFGDSRRCLHDKLADTIVVVA